jgi:hypothetical protein
MCASGLNRHLRADHVSFAHWRKATPELNRFTPDCRLPQGEWRGSPFGGRIFGAVKKGRNDVVAVSLTRVVA